MLENYILKNQTWCYCHINIVKQIRLKTLSTSVQQPPKKYHSRHQHIVLMSEHGPLKTQSWILTWDTLKQLKCLIININRRFTPEYLCLCMSAQQSSQAARSSWTPSNCLRWKWLSVCLTIPRRATKPERACVSMNRARIKWTPLSRGWIRMAWLKSWNRIKGNCSRRLRSQKPASSGTFSCKFPA